MKRTSKLTQATQAFIYIRVSTARQAKEGIGLDAQEAKCQAHAQRMGLPVAHVFADEGISGKEGLDGRPGLNALLNAVQAARNAVVIVYSVSRLARRQRLLWQLLDDREGLGLAVSSATEPFDTSTPMGRAMLGMLATFAQLEADMVSERTRDALAEARAQGTRLGRAPMIDANPEIVALVKEINDSGRFTAQTLANELNSRQIPTISGTGKWWPKTVRTALSA